MKILLLLNIFIQGINIWVEPSWVTTGLSHPSPHSHYEAQLFSAKGEEESFQVHISADKSDLNNISLTFDKLPEGFSSPELYQILPIQGVPLPKGGIDRSLTFLDILKPFQTCNLLKGQKTVLWVTFKIPQNVKSGLYKTELQINTEKEKLKRIPITIEVFDFEIPPISSLPAVSFLDWQTLVLTNPQSTSTDDFWKYLFNFLHDKHINPSLGSYLQSIHSDSFPIPDIIWKNYIDSLKDQKSQTFTDITPLLLPPGPLETVHNFNQRETEILNSIKGINDSITLCSIWFTPKANNQNDLLKRYLNSVSEQLPFVARILCSPPLPQYNFYTDIWALPFSSFSPGLMERLTKGLTIADENTIPIKSVSASSTGFIPGSYPPILSSPWYSIDGCLYTGWLSLPAEKEIKNEWLEIQLKEKIVGEKITLVWGPGQTPQSIDVQTSRDGFHFLTSSTNWRHVAGTLFDPPISYGTFKYNPDFIAIRLEFPKTKKGDVVYIPEVRLNPTEQNKEPRPAPVIIPWLWLNPEQYPSLRYDTVPIESRIIPWICWNYGFNGIVLTPLISWGNTITKPQRNGDFLFQPQNTMDMTTLLYPAKDGYISSVRLERLRDGLEDYEYLLLFAQKAQSKKLKNEELYNYLILQPEKFLPWNIMQDNFAEELMKRRISIGYELSDKESPYKEGKMKPSTKIDKEQPTGISPKVQKNFSIRQKSAE